MIRLEVEFKTEKDAQSYVPPSWAKKEITNTPLGKDSTLVKLGTEEFKLLYQNLFAS